MTDIYIDVGFMKSGTKFREYILYPAIKDVKLYNFPFSKQNPMYIDFESENKIVLVDESLSGSLYRPECDVIMQRNHSIKNMKIFFPEANIIVCKRNGNSLMQSAYRQYVFSGGINNYESWKKRINPNIFDFDKYIESLKNNFERVLVLDFNLLIKDANMFAKEICEFMDVEVPIFTNRRINASLTNGQTKIWRLFNHIWKTHENKYGIPVYKFFRKIVEQIGVKES